MKKVIAFTCCLAVLMGCSQDPKVEIIKEHEETIFGVQTDMSFKLNSLEFISEVTGRDSMKAIFNELFPKDTFDITKNYIDTFYNIYSESLEKSELTLLKYDSMIEASNDYDMKIIYLDAKIDLIDSKTRTAKNKRKWETPKNRYDRFIGLQDSVIGKLYQATYTIKNPMLNNAKQTITKQYLFSPDELEIVSTIPIEESQFSK